MNQEITGTEENVRVPVMQKIMDNPFLSGESWNL